MNKIEKKDVSTLAAGARFALVGKILGRGLHVVGQVVLARILGPAGLGIYSLGWNSLRIISLVAPLGMDKGVIRFASHHFESRETDETMKKIVVQSLQIALASSIFMGIVFFVFAPVLAVIYQNPALTEVFRLTSLAIPFATILIVGASATSISQDVRYSIWSEEITQPGVNIVLILLFYWFGMGLSGAMLAGVLSFVIAAGLALYYLKRLVPGAFTWKSNSSWLNKALLSYSLPIALSGTFSTLILLLDRLMIGYYRSEYETGIYQAISLYSLIFVTILSALKTIFSPMISELYNTGASNRFHGLYKLSTKWGIYFGIPFILILLFSPGEIIQLLFGKEYMVGTSALTILILGQIANIGTGPVDVMLMMTDHQKEWLWITGVGLVINIILNILWIPQFGYVGAAASVSLTLSAIYITGLIRVRQVLGIWPYDGQYLKGIFVSLFTIFALFGINQLDLGTSAFLHLLIISVVSFGIFFTGLWVLKLDEEDEELLKTIKQKF